MAKLSHTSAETRSVVLMGVVSMFVREELRGEDRTRSHPRLSSLLRVLSSLYMTSWGVARKCALALGSCRHSNFDSVHVHQSERSDNDACRVT